MNVQGESWVMLLINNKMKWQPTVSVYGVFEDPEGSALVTNCNYYLVSDGEGIPFLLSPQKRVTRTSNIFLILQKE